MTDDGEEVLLYVYDLSNGFARLMSQSLLGKQLDGIWHTSVVVGGVETFFGNGIQRAVPGATPHGAPVQVISLGRTSVPAELREEYLADMGRGPFAKNRYNLMHHNCNNFSQSYGGEFLTGSAIPEHILALPAEVLATPFGQQLAPMAGGLQAQLRAAVPPAPPSLAGLLAQLPRGPPAAAGPGPAAQQPATAPAASAGAGAAAAGPGAAAPGPRAPDFAAEIRAAAAGAAAAAAGAPAPGRERPIGAVSGLVADVPPAEREQTHTELDAGGEGVARGVAARAPEADAGVHSGPGHAVPGSAGAAETSADAPAAHASARSGVRDGAALSAPGGGAGAGAAGVAEAEAQAKRAFEAAVRAEFVRLMAGGGLSPNEAAALAVQHAAAARA